MPGGHRRLHGAYAHRKMCEGGHCTTNHTGTTGASGVLVYSPSNLTLEVTRPIAAYSMKEGSAHLITRHWLMDVCDEEASHVHKLVLIAENSGRRKALVC